MELDANTADSPSTKNDIYDGSMDQIDLPNISNEELLQQATAIQEQGYQMMTPEQIDRELAAMDLQNTQDINNINNSNKKY